MWNYYLLPLISLGVKIEDIYITCRLKNNISVTDFIQPYLSAKFLPYLEFHASDHCNLNCRGCSHFSGLVTKPTFPVLEIFTRDLEKLHKFIDDIKQIRIMGGEPLLNPEVGEYVKLCRRLYPKTFLHVVTNGLLLQKMSDNFFDIVKSNNAVIDISVYPPIKNHIPQIAKFLQEKKVAFRVLKFVDKFSIKHTMNKHNKIREIFLKCSRANCHFLYDGKIAACCFPFMVKYFNNYFQKNLPSNGFVDLYEEGITTEKIKLQLATPFELCGYCTNHVNVKWATISHPSPITDWTNDHLTKRNF